MSSSKTVSNAKPQNMELVATFFALWLATYFQDQIEDILAFGLILSLGILHGSNDLALIKKKFQMGDQRVWWRALPLYVGIVISGIAFFYFFPFVSLMVFIVCSAYHFGEQHWSGRWTGTSLFKQLLYVSYGMFIFGLLFLTNKEEVTPIIEDITEVTVPVVVYEAALWVSGVGFGLYLAVGALQKQLLASTMIKELFLLLVFFIVFSTASLLWAFAIYFIFWHSIPSIKDQIQYLYGTNKKEDFMKYIKSSLLFWVLAMVSLFGLYWLLKGHDKLFLSVFFTLIAAITFPHVLIISRLHR